MRADIFGKEEKGSVLVEFALSMVAFFLFVYGLIAVSLWGAAGEFVQQAAHEAARSYAVMLDEDYAREKAETVLGRWGYVFVEPGTVQVAVEREGETATAVVSAEPRVERLYVFELGRVEKQSSCVLECRYRSGGCGIW